MAHSLSARETGVVELLLQGKSNKQIALALGISARTVEFHLKNIYTKFHVSSRIELVLRLGNATGRTLDEKPGYSTVDPLGGKAENRDEPHSQVDWAACSGKNTSTLGKEFDMKTLSNLTHILVGGMTSLFIGFSWIAIFIYYGNLTASGVKEWALPLIAIFALMGGTLGIIGRHNRSALRKIALSALFGTSLSFFSIIPIMLIVILPLEKLAVQAGLPDPFGSSRMASDVSNLAGTITMIAIWLVAGIAIGTALLFVSVRKPERMDNPILKNA